MAYFIFSKTDESNKKYTSAIAENDSKLQELKVLNTGATTVTVSDADFQLVKKNIKRAYLNADNSVSFDDYPEAEIGNAAGMSAHIQTRINTINSWLFTRSKSHPNRSTVEAYKTKLENFNVDSVTYPLAGSLEKYFADNSETYFNLLELPA